MSDTNDRPGRADSAVQVVRRDAVVTIALSRPDQANALTSEAKDALLSAITQASEDVGVRAVVLTGSGRAFCAGQDLAEHARALRADPVHAFDTVGKHYSPIVLGLTTMPKPVIAKINGTCAGAGLGFALACDLRIAAAGVRFATAFGGIGLTADSGLSATLQRAVGASRASALLLLGTPFSAEQAVQIGLIHEVVPPEELDGRAIELADRLAAGPTQAFAAMKEGLRRSATADLAEVLHLEGELQARLAVTSDHRGAVEAFLEKRRPEFTGR